jgi:hypothetical protein
MNARISAEEFDRKFDDGESVLEHLDLATRRRGAWPAKRVNVDMPAAMVARLDQHAKKRGVTRQALIKMWLADKLDSAA